MRKIIAIPARLASSRLPNKLLLPYKGKPILRHVIENAIGSNADYVLVLSEDDELLDLAKHTTANCFPVKTKSFANGTEKLAHGLKHFGLKPGDKIINLQGDLPLLKYNYIDSLFEDISDDCLATFGISVRDGQVPSRVKIVTGLDGTALYFSRSPIPYGADAFLEHVGIYGFPASFFDSYATLKPAAFGKEDLEQLSWLANGFKIKVRQIDYTGISIDTQDDYERLCHLST
jgi:3-deoxy-manno-octulosonate cytidylyltransferase (CMP-KDO synthetase)